MERQLAVILVCWTSLCSVVLCDYQLTSSVSVGEGQPCPGGVVIFTCVGSNLKSSDSVRWYLNGDEISRSPLSTDHTYPWGVESTTPGVNITIVTVREEQTGSLLFVNSTLQSVLVSLKPYSVGCGSIAAGIETITVSSNCREEATRVSVEPSSLTCGVNKNAAFQCRLALPSSSSSSSSSSATPNVTWTINGTAVDLFSGFTVQRGGNDGSRLLVTKCRVEWSGTRIQCAVLMGDEKTSSNTGRLYVDSQSVAVLDFITTNWKYVVVILVIGIATGLSLLLLVCCCCALCRSCFHDKTRANTPPQDAGQDPSFRSRVGTSKGVACVAQAQDIDKERVQRNQERMKQEAEERVDFLTAMKNLPDGYPSGTFQERPAMGSRLQKHWGTVTHRETGEEMIITRAPLSKSCKLAVTKDMETVAEIVRLLRQNPQLHDVQDIFPDSTKEGFVLIVKPPAKQSLRDLIQKNKDIYADWADKYTEVGAPLTPERIRHYGRQILDAIISLYDFGFSSVGHIQTGNIYVDANVCQLGGFENTLLGYRSRLHTRIAEGGHLESIDVVMFGHVIYEMCTGRELRDLVPSEQEYMLVEDEGCKDFLQHIFKRREDGSFKSTIKKIRGHGFVKPALASVDVRKLLDVVAGRPIEESAGGTIYEKVTGFAKKVFKGAETSGRYSVRSREDSELKEVTSDDLETPLLQV